MGARLPAAGNPGQKANRAREAQPRLRDDRGGKPRFRKEKSCDTDAETRKGTPIQQRKESWGSNVAESSSLKGTRSEGLD